MTTIVVIAKECVPGRVKTRLSPPFSPDQAARLAQASLDDTLETVRGLPAARRVLAFDGATPPASAVGFEVVPQVDGGLDARLAAVFDALEGPVLLVGMDTPQLAPRHVAPVLAPWPVGVDAWLGPASDGGFWALALARPDGDLIRGVPMSRSDTGARQRERLVGAGLGVGALPELVDVDDAGDARTVAEAAPSTRFAHVLAELTSERAHRAGTPGRAAEPLAAGHPQGAGATKDRS